MWSSWLTAAVVALVCSIATALPLVFLDTRAARGAYAGVACVFTALIAATVAYNVVTVPLLRIAAALAASLGGPSEALGTATVPLHEDCRKVHAAALDVLQATAARPADGGAVPLAPPSAPPSASPTAHAVSAPTALKAVCPEATEASGADWASEQDMFTAMSDASGDDHGPRITIAASGAFAGNTPARSRATARSPHSGAEPPMAEAPVAEAPVAEAPTPSAAPTASEKTPLLHLFRGERYAGDNPRVCMIIARAKNANLVVYEGRLEGRLEQGKALDAYWMDVDPAYVAKARAKGRTSDRVELNLLERKLAYGAECTPAAEPGTFDVRFTALKARAFVLRSMPVRVSASSTGPTADAVLPVLTGTIAGQPAVAERIYVASVEATSLFSLPTVDYVELSGRALADGTAVVERIAP